jgi:hypothetical protein
MSSIKSRKLEIDAIRRNADDRTRRFSKELFAPAGSSDHRKANLRPADRDGIPFRTIAADMIPLGIRAKTV